MTRARRPFASLTFVAAVFCAQFRTHIASGDEGAALLTWTAPAGCPTEAEVMAQIRSVVGSPVSAHEPVRARAAVVQGEGETWRGDLELSVGTQTSAREIEGETCRAVADAVVLMVALTVNPDAVRVPPPERPASPPTPPPAPATPSAPSLPAPEDASRSFPANRRPVAAGASFLLGEGSLPAIAPGAEATLDWEPSRFGLEASVAFLAPQRAILAIRPEGATFWLAHAGARACYEVVRSVIDLAPCAGGGAEWTFAQGLGSTFPASATARSAVLSLGGRALAHLSSHLALRLTVEAVLPLARPLFVIHGVEGDETVFQASRFQGRATAGAEIYF